MTSPQEFSDKEIDEAWKSIEEDLSDIAAPSADEFDFPAAATTMPSQPVGDPRAWSGPDEDIIESFLAEEDDTSYKDVTDEDLAVERPHIALSWMGAIAIIALGVGISTGFLPGSSSFGIVLLVIGCMLAALAALWTARRAWEDNPFDDGARP